MPRVRSRRIPDSAFEEKAESAILPDPEAPLGEPAASESETSSADSQPETQPDPEKGKTYPIIETVVGGGTQYGNLFIKTDSGMELPDFTEELASDPDVSVAVERVDRPCCCIIRTRSEAYMESDSTFYYESMKSRSDDPSRTVVAVGDAIAKALEEAGIGVDS